DLDGGPLPGRRGRRPLGRCQAREGVEEGVALVVERREAVGEGGGTRKRAPRRRDLRLRHGAARRPRKVTRRSPLRRGRGVGGGRGDGAGVASARRGVRVAPRGSARGGRGSRRSGSTRRGRRRASRCAPGRGRGGGEGWRSPWRWLQDGLAERSGSGGSKRPATPVPPGRPP